MSLSGWPSYYLFVTKVQIIMADLTSGFSAEASNHRIPHFQLESTTDCYCQKLFYGCYGWKHDLASIC